MALYNFIVENNFCFGMWTINTPSDLSPGLIEFWPFSVRLSILLREFRATTYFSPNRPIKILKPIKHLERKGSNVSSVQGYIHFWPVIIPGKEFLFTIRGTFHDTCLQTKISKTFCFLKTTCRCEIRPFIFHLSWIDFCLRRKNVPEKCWVNIFSSNLHYGKSYRKLSNQ